MSKVAVSRGKNKLVNVKGTVSPDKICLKVVWFIRPILGYVTLDITNFLYSPFNFVLSVEVLIRPTLNTYQLTFS